MPTISLDVIINLALRIACFLAGGYLVILTVMSAVQTFVLPRARRDALTRRVFFGWRVLFHLRLKKVDTYEERDRIFAYYAPLALVSLPAVWMFMVFTGYALIFRATVSDSWQIAFTLSGSSLLTLGFIAPDGWFMKAMVFSEAVIGLTLIALLIAYLPTMYSSFQQREAMVSLMEVRAGDPPSAFDMFDRLNNIHKLDELETLFPLWEQWFLQIDESHTSLAPLIFFRSPRHTRSWVTTAGVILDACSLYVSTLDLPENPKARLTIRAGYLALRHIADVISLPFDHNPSPTDKISIFREEFDYACDQLRQAGLPLKSDLDQAWRDFVGWRVNYDSVLLQLAEITIAPYAMWSSDRGRMNRPAQMFGGVLLPKLRGARLPKLRFSRSRRGQISKV
jgi:hypothetical protein